MEYGFSKRNQAEKDLKRALEEISSENNELSSKAKDALLDFDTMISSSSVERHWTSIRVNEERERTRAVEIISNEKVVSNIFEINF